jgi:hypothetical protein
MADIREIARHAVPAACRMISASLSTISNAIRPMPTIKYIGTDGKVPADYVLLRNEYGQLMWMPMESYTSNPLAKYPLTEGQKRKITTIQNIFHEVTNWGLDYCIDGFGRDAAGVDQEIDLWLMMAELYVQECADRGDLDMDEKKGLFYALTLLSTHGSEGKFLQDIPGIRRLKHFERICMRWKDRIRANIDTK